MVPFPFTPRKEGSVKKMKMLTFYVLVEADDDEIHRATNFVTTRVVDSCRRIQRAELAVAAFEVDGDAETLLSVTVVNTPSEEMQELIRAEFYKETA